MREFLRQQHHEDSLLIGAASRIEGLEVRAAEDVDEMNAADPVKNWSIEFDPVATARRESAIVKKILASESPVIILVLGREHDLSDNVPKGVEVVRIGAKAYVELSGE